MENKLIDLKRDWLVLLICIITMVANLYFFNAAQSKIDIAVDNCNQYWQQQIKGRYSTSLVNPNISFADSIKYTPAPMPGEGGE